MTCSIFWGILLVLIGLSLIIKVAFHLDLPVFRIFIAFFLIYLGIKLFFGKEFRLYNRDENGNNILFGERIIHNIKNGSEYNFIFGRGILDLRKMNVSDNQDISIKLNTVFAGSEIILNDSVNLMIHSNSAFGGVKMPDGSTSAFGSMTYTNDTLSGRPVIRIETNTVFGETRFK